MNFLALLFIFTSTLALAEPSAFGAGDLTKNEPYGLSESEKHIYKNKKDLEKIEEQTHAQNSQVETLLERIDGLQTIVEGLSEKSYNLSKDTENFKKELGDSGKSEELISRIEANEKNIAELKNALTELSKVIDSINKNYISKDDFNSLVKEINTIKDVVSKDLKKSTEVSSKTTSSNFSGLDNSVILKEANELYEKKSYAKAIERFEYLLEKKYQPARSNFMLGEIYYYKKKYDQAIAYFKESATLYDKATYMPTLMFHTAVSMQETGDVKNAKTFYNAVVAKYPDDQIAAEAKKRLAKLK